jgi:hypothetical protein
MDFRHVIAKPGEIQPGDIYEDCSYHPVLCTEILEDGEVLTGISLIDASAPRSCSIPHCGPVKLSVTEVLEARRDFAAYVARRQAEVATGG